MQSYYGIARGIFKVTESEFWDMNMFRFRALRKIYFDDEEKQEFMPLDRLKALQEKYPDGN